MAHFVLTTFGSLGDLHPYIAVGRGLSARGHMVTIATSEVYRAKVEGEGLCFHSLRPNMADVLDDPAAMRRAFHPLTGMEYVCKMFQARLEQSYEDLLPLARQADLIVGHPLAYVTPLVAEVLGKPWISVILQPALLLSVFDPPSVSGLPQLEWFRGAGTGFWRAFFQLANYVAGRWCAPVGDLRRKLGLRGVRSPVLDEVFSPYGNQAWFSGVIAQRQPDWPEKMLVTGFPFYDKQDPGKGMSDELNRFLESGPAPVVFTLGSSAVLDAGAFYEQSAEAAGRLGCRAVLLVGSDPRNQPRKPLPETFFIGDYAPYSELLPRAAATAHQGGSGTTAQALASGKPMIVVPWSHDQPDNARRVVRLGVGRMIPRSRCTAKRLAEELRIILGDARYGVAAAGVAGELAKEDGVRSACDGIEAAMRGPR